MSEHPINDVLTNTMQKIKEMLDVNTVIGDAIVTDSGVTVIPVSRVTVGFASGGSDIGNKSNKNLFGGGGGAGVSLTPLAFITINPDGEVKLLQLSDDSKAVDHAVGLVPEMFDKITGLFKKGEKDGDK